MVYNESQALKDAWFIPVFFGLQFLGTAIALVYGVIESDESTSNMVLAIILFVSFLVVWMIVSMKLQIRLILLRFLSKALHSLILGENTNGKR